MAEMNAINHKSWLTWLGKVLLAVAIIMVLSTVHGSSAMALSHIGPSSPGDRYSMTRDSTHTYEELHVPVYFKDNPGSVRVFVEDTKWRGGAYFNGTLIYGPGGEFTVSGFQYDKETGYWKSMIIAHMASKLMFQFRLRLERTDGIIAYAKGAASQASNHYNNDMDDLLGPFETKEMQMALPCSFTQPTRIGPNTPYHFILYDLDTWYPEWHETKKHNNKWWHNNGMSTINVRVIDENTNEVVAEYKGKDYQCGRRGEGVREGPQCMGENGVLDIDMVMLPGHKYKTLIGPTWKNNLIEYELPFDNIFYNISCEPKIDMRAAVDYIDEAGRKRASAQGKYDSQNNSESRSDVFVFDQWGHNARTTWSSKGVSPDPAIIRKEDAKVTPGKFLTWWFRAHNVSGYPPPDKTDFANFRTTFNGSTSGWDEMTVYPPRRATNWFQPSKRGGKLDRNHPQVTWGCNEWGTNCVDHYDWYNRGVSFGESISYHYRYQVRADDAEKTLCQRVRNSWPVGQDWKERFTPWACAYVPYDYPPNQPPPGGGKDNSGVVPTAREEHGKTKVQAGDDVQFSYSLTNTSGPTVSRQIVYRPHTFILRRGAKLPQNSGQKPYHYAKKWDGSGVGCGGRDIDPGAQSRCEPGVFGTSGKIYPGQTWPVLEKPKYNVSNFWLAQPGDKICSYIAVDNNWSVTNDQSADTFRASNIACVVVTKSPNLNLSGSDSYADKGFQGASVSKSDMVPGTDKRGSYSQYGLLTGDTKVTNFGSAGYTTADSNYHHLACKLSYANTDSAQGNCNDLKWLKPAGLPKKSLSMPSSTNTTPLPGGSNVDLGGLQSGNYKAGSGSLKIHGYLGKGIHITIFAEQADVTITGDIDAYAGPYHKLSDIPSFTIKAKNIKVDPGVGLITGTYVARGKFESCKGAQNKTDDLGMKPTSRCQNKLKINGAIVSEGSPAFLRTFGAGNRSEDDQRYSDRISSTAEWINYTPNLWLTTSNGSSGNQLEGLTTTQVTNLPVRY
ncbi:MAG: hypothetical protein ACFNL6_02470 [Candidatus Nanoperiomorbus sp.]